MGRFIGQRRTPMSLRRQQKKPRRRPFD